MTGWTYNDLVATWADHLPLQTQLVGGVKTSDTDEHKPSPVPLLLCLEQLGAPAEGAIYVGDSPVDSQAGAAAGMATAAVAWGVFGKEALMAVAPDFWVAAPHELLDLCLRGRAAPGRLGAP